MSDVRVQDKERRRAVEQKEDNEAKTAITHTCEAAIQSNNNVLLQTESGAVTGSDDESENDSDSKQDGVPWFEELFSSENDTILAERMEFNANTQGVVEVQNEVNVKAFNETALKTEGAARYLRIQERILLMTRLNIEQQTNEITRILEEGNILYSSEGSHIIEKLVEKINLFYQEPSFAQLIRALSPSYQRNGSPHKANLLDLIWRHLGKVNSQSEAAECIAKIKVLLPLYGDLCTRLLWRYTEQCHIEEVNLPFVKILTFLIEEGADPFDQVEGRTVFHLFLEKFSPNLPAPLLPSALKFLEEAINKGAESNDAILNDVIKFLPVEVLESDSNHLLSIKKLIIDTCLNLIKKDPSICDHVDDEGSTPLQNLIQKLLIDGLWERMAKTLTRSDSLWDLMCQLITPNNLTEVDKYKLHPFTWVLWWKESVQALHNLDEADRKALNVEIGRIENTFVQKGANKEESLHELKFVHYRRIEMEIQNLNHSCKTKQSQKVLKIMKEGKICCPASWLSVFKMLVDKVDKLYQEPSFTELIEVAYERYERYRRSALLNLDELTEINLKKLREELTEIIWMKLKDPWIESELEAKRCIKKLEHFIPLHLELSTRLLWEFANYKEWNVHVVNLWTFLIKKGADPFEPILGTTVFKRTLEDSGGWPVSLMPAMSIYLEEAFMKWTVSKETDTILNDTLKFIPSYFFEGHSEHMSAIVEVVVRNCLKISMENPVLCDNFDNEGKSAFHNFLEKLLIEDSWKRIPEFMAGTGSLWDLILQLTTTNNVNERDMDGIAPYTLVLLWQELTSDQISEDGPGFQNFLTTTEEVKQNFLGKGANEELAAQGLILLRYRYIEQRILHLTKCNIERETGEILKILAIGDIAYPEEGPSIMKMLVDQMDDMYQEISFTRLIKALHPSYHGSKLSMKEDLVNIVWRHTRFVWPEGEPRPLEVIWIDNMEKANTVMEKLKIFLPLEPMLGPSILATSIKYFDPDKEANSHFVDVLSFLVKEGANPFESVCDTTVFPLFLEKFVSNQILSEPLMPSISIFLEEAIDKGTESNENILNDIIKFVPSKVLEGDCDHLSSIKKLIVDNCLELIKKCPVICDHVDDEGGTPLQNLIQKLVIDGLWERMVKTLARADSLWDLMCQLITPRNVTIVDKYKMNPLTWVLWWQKSVTSLQDLDDEELQALTIKIARIEETFIQKGASKEDSIQELKFVRYRRIMEKVKMLTRKNISVVTHEILNILARNNAVFPREGPPIIKLLIDGMDDLYQDVNYAKLIQIFWPNNTGCTPSMREDLIYSICLKLGSPFIDSENDARECCAKLKIFLPLDHGLGTRMLCMLIEHCDFDKEGNSHFIEVLTYMVKEGADLFDPIHGKSAFTLFLEKFCSSQSESLTPSVLNFLKEVCNRFQVSNAHKTILNDVIKAVPNKVFESHYVHLSDIKDLVLNLCLRIIEMSPAFCDTLDDEGRAPVHILIEKLLKDNLWKRIPELTTGSDTIWQVLSELATPMNINIKDNYKLSPYSWVLWWQTLIMALPSAGEMRRNVCLLQQRYLEKGASETAALEGLTCLGKIQMEHLLRKLINLHRHIDEQLANSEKSSQEIIAEFEIDLKTAYHLVREGCGECLHDLSLEEDFRQFAGKHIRTVNKMILNITEGILDVITTELNAQQIFDIFMEHEEYVRKEGTERIDYGVLLNVLKRCLDKGANPTEDQIKDLSLLTVVECKSSKALLFTVQMMEQFLNAFRKQEMKEQQGKKKCIEVYLNAIQDQYIVSDELRESARRVAREAYGTAHDCMKSESVINILLFISNGDCDDETVRKCFCKVDGLLHKIESPVARWVDETQKDMERRKERDLEDENSKKKREENQRYELRKMLVRRNDNWLNRTLLHFAAMFCHDEATLKCIPEELIRTRLIERDAHGSTLLHIAYLHGNQFAIQFFETKNESAPEDYFHRTPAPVVIDLADNQYKEDCRKIIEKESYVRDTMKRMLVLPVKESKAIKNNFEELFKRMVADDKLLDAEVVIAGSVREKLKIGRFDEVDLQICHKSKAFYKKPFGCLRFHEYLIKRIAEVSKKGIYLRCISVENPWTFLWEGEGCYNRLEISVDVVPVFIEVDGEIEHFRQDFIIGNGPGHQKIRHLKWKELEAESVWRYTVCRHEWNILDSLPLGCRMGILFAKTFLEALGQIEEDGSDFLKKPITSYAVKNALFWVIAKETPVSIEELHGNVIKNRYDASCQLLDFKEEDTVEWMTERVFQRNAEDGRLWAERIFDAIQFLARNYKRTPGSFLQNKQSQPDMTEYQVFDVLATCEKCLNRLKQDYLFTEKGNNSTGTINTHRTTGAHDYQGKNASTTDELPGYNPNDILDGGELDITTMDKFALLCGLPTPSALHLQSMSPTGMTTPVAPNESATAIHYISNHYVVSTQQNGKILIYDSLYHAQRVQQLLPQLRCLYHIGTDEPDIEYLVPLSQGLTSDCGLFAAAYATMLIHGINPLTITLNQERLRYHMHLCQRTKKVRLFPTEDNPCKEDKNQEQGAIQQAKAQAGVGTIDQTTGAHDNASTTDELPGYNPNDVLDGGELDITTMDKFALLCGLPTPSAVHLQSTSPTGMTTPVAPNESVTAILYISNHYVVSTRQNGKILIYDSLYHTQRVQQLLPQLRCLYNIGTDEPDEPDIEYLVPQSQGLTSDCGLFAAAYATMLIHGIDPLTITLNQERLRYHMHLCLRTKKIRLFPRV